MSEYHPLRPTGGNLYSNGPDQEIYQENGFYQPGPMAEVARRRDAVLPYLEGLWSIEEMPLRVYQEWTELDWKAPHGSYTAVERFMDKMVEEGAVELRDAEAAHVAAPTETTKKEYISEEGDALWTTTAIASNGGVNITQAVREYLRTWYLHPEAEGDITFGTLSQKMGDHEPTNIVDPIFILNWKDHLPDTRMYMQWFSIVAGNILDRQYGYNEGFDRAQLSRFIIEMSGVVSPRALKTIDIWTSILGDLTTTSEEYQEISTYITESYFQHIARTLLKPMIGEGVAFLDYMSRLHGVTLAEAALKNIQKISGRVATNTVDKKDGVR